jgi:hypothetical protein
MTIDFSGTNHNHPHPRFPEAPSRINLEDDDPRALQCNLGNAVALFRLLGLPLEDGAAAPYGEVPIADARRAVIRARARFAREAPNLVRPSYTEYGPPRTCDDGIVELRPLRMYVGGLDEEGIAYRLDAFAQFVEAIAERGATHIAWS